MQSAGWVLTTYETLRDYQLSFGKVQWAVVAFDEAQRIKNPAAQVTDAAKALQADFFLALTGTPVENHIGDLWSIVDAVSAGELGALTDFVRRYQADQPDYPTRLADLQAKLTTPPPARMLRRTKAEQLDGLPTIEVVPLRSEMPATQAAAYVRVVEEARRGGKGGILKALQALRAVSLHPASGGGAADSDFIGASARLVETFKILDVVAARQEKALIFIEALAMQGVLAEILQRRYSMESPPLIINGGVAGERRKARVDRFQGRLGFDVMLLSPRAAGVGLTITAANHVIHLSRWWNPAVEDQATDRVYRIGQKRPVKVYVPMAIHPEFGDRSFDVTLSQLLASKRALGRTLLMPAVMSPDETTALFMETVGEWM